MEELDDEKNAVLVDNTAQAVFKHLDRIRDGRAVLGTRWIWELLQNARDVATEAGVAVSIEVSASRLVFRHNGKPFRVADVTHLIYHGSTKVDLEGAVGRYGSGFLSTHLLSPIVRVRGRLEDGRCFDFQIDRSGTDVHALSAGMEKSWQSFKASIEAEDFSAEGTAEFEYSLDDGADELVAAGLDQLRACVSLVLAFAPELASIRVVTTDANWRMSRAESTQLAGSVSLLRIESQESGQSIARFVALVREGNLAVAALPLEEISGGMHVSLTSSVPRLYVLFPMVTTERLSLPVAISSLQFKPREDRDGLSLNGTTEGPAENRRILEQASQQILLLLRCAATQGWIGIERLISFDTSDLPDWVEHDWYARFMRELLDVVREIPLLRVEGNEQLAPEEALIPFGADEAQCLAVAKYASGLRDLSSKLPRADLVLTWYLNVTSWARLLGTAVEDIPEVLTMEGVAGCVADTETLDQLQLKLSAEAPVIEWLGEVIQDLLDSELAALLDELSLLPSQSGELQRRSELRFDVNIDEAIKDIAAGLGLDLRAHLLDARVKVPALGRLLTEMTEAEALTEVVQHLKSACSDDRIAVDVIKPSIRLFGWINAHPGYEAYLWGFPLATADGDERSVLTFELSHHAAEDERPMAPTAYWPERLQQFASLFPKRKILNEAFARSDLLADVWDQLANVGILHRGPVYTSARKPNDFVPDDTIVEGTDEHEATDAVNVSDIAYLRGDDYAVLDTVRRSSVRALEFIRLLWELANDANPEALDTASVQCICGHPHQFYRAGWLEPVRSRTWVPGGSDGRRTSRLSAESLAELVEESPDVVHNLAQECGSKLLAALNISPADFMLRVVAKDEDARVSLIRSMGDLAQAAGGDPDRVRQLVDEIREHPEILDEISRQKTQRDRVRRNQQIGGLVEELLRIALVGEGLSVERTGVGSDFEVDSDLIDEGEEIVLRVTEGKSATLVEIKSTRSDGAKMTPRQADTARNFGEHFALCVVDLGDLEPTIDLVRDRCRFVFGIGDRLQSVWTQYESIQHATAVARSQVGPIVIDVIEGQYRFMIGNGVWRAGLTFEQAVAAFLAA